MGRSKGRARRLSSARSNKPSQLTILTERPSGERPESGAPRPQPNLAPARVSELYDVFWYFAAERQRVFFRRLHGGSRPWTDDPILAVYKFTNAYRASDRVSQYLIRNVIYRGDLPTCNKEIVFRVLLFKIFNKIETWELLERELGTLTFSAYRYERYDSVLSRAMSAGRRIYSAAYIMPPGTSAFGSGVKHRNHLRLLEHMISSGLPDRLSQASSMQEAFTLLRAYQTIGDFLAYQFAIDINYSEVTNFTEMDFVVPGPGARDGLRKCIPDSGGLNEVEMIRLIADLQETEFERLGIEFPSLWGRRLQLIDVQNLLCEISKFARVAYPSIAGLTPRMRIKQKFSPNSTQLSYWYPPKWEINNRLG